MEKKETNKICIYHSRDLDGKCSASVVLKKYKKIDLKPWNYNDPLPDIPSGSDIVIVDVCLLNRGDFYPMGLLSDDSNSVIWIDHHMSNLEAFNKYPNTGKNAILKKIDLEKSACELTWEYFYPNQEMPRIVKLLGSYDIWRNVDDPSWEDEVLPFQYGMKLSSYSVEALKDLINSTIENKEFEKKFIENKILDGEIISAYQKRQNNITTRFNAYKKYFRGLNAMVVNTPNATRLLFDGFVTSDLDILICWNFDGSKYKYTLYSTQSDVDVSQIAKRFGGGGHKKVAGFESKTDVLQ